MEIKEKIKNIDLILLDKQKKQISFIFENKTTILEMVVEKSITEGFFYKITSTLTPQSRSALWEKRIINLVKGKKVKTKEDKGDVKIKDNYYEIKISGMNEDNALHLVQLRPWQEVDYIVQFIEKNTYKSHFYHLTAQNMKDEIEITKATAAHGTKTANKDNEKIELRLSIKNFKNSNHFKRWEKNYKIELNSLK